MMQDKEWKATAKSIYFKRENLENERKALNDEIDAIRTEVREGLVDEKTPKKKYNNPIRKNCTKRDTGNILTGK